MLRKEPETATPLNSRCCTPRNPSRTKVAASSLHCPPPWRSMAAMYAICQEKDKYGDLQNYICDLDNNVRLDVAAISNYYDGQDPDPDETALKIVKLEEGTKIPLEGAVFSVYDPEGRKVGSFSTGPDGTVVIPLTLEGHYTVTEEIRPGIIFCRMSAPSTRMWSTTRLQP